MTMVGARAECSNFNPGHNGGVATGWPEATDLELSRGESGRECERGLREAVLKTLDWVDQRRRWAGLRSAIQTGASRITPNVAGQAQPNPSESD
jgi:hypothetical protein